MTFVHIIIRPICGKTEPLQMMSQVIVWHLISAAPLIMVLHHLYICCRAVH